MVYSPCVDFNIITVYEYARRTKEWCVSSLGSTVAPSVYKVSSNMRRTKAGRGREVVYMWARRVVRV